MIGIGNLFQAGAGGTTTVCTPAALTVTSPASLHLNLDDIQILQLSDIDATPYGALPSNTNEIMQQGYAAAQTLIFTTSALSSGQSQWAVVQCAFEQVDIIPAADPNAGLLPYYNAANPTQPLQGPGGSGATQNTDRTAVASVSIVYGTPSSGTPTVPSASGGNVALYAILLTYGQTQITTIDVCSPTIQAGYPYAPFYPGLTGRGPLYSSGSHHHGTVGEAAQINLGTEVTGTAPLTVLPVTDTNPPATGGVITQGGLIPIEVIVNTNPNGNVAGQFGDLAINSATSVPYWCSTAGTSSTAVWQALTGGLTPINITTAPYTAAQLQAFYSCSYAGNLAFTLTTLPTSGSALVIVENNNSFTVTVSAAAGQTINGSSSSMAIAGLSSAVAFYRDPSSSTNWLSYVLGANNLIGTANPNSVQGGTAGQFFYDVTHAVNYICTTSGGASTAVWTRLSEPIGTYRWHSPAAYGSNDIPTGWHVCDGTTVNGITLPNMIGMYPLGGQPTGYGATPNANGFGTNTVDTDTGTTEHSHGFNLSGANGGGTIGSTDAFATNAYSGATESTEYLPAAHVDVWLMRVY